jgi:hypothetical protein
MCLFLNLTFTRTVATVRIWSLFSLHSKLQHRIHMDPGLDRVGCRGGVKFLVVEACGVINALSSHTAPLSSVIIMSALDTSGELLKTFKSDVTLRYMLAEEGREDVYFKGTISRDLGFYFRVYKVKTVSSVGTQKTIKKLTITASLKKAYLLCHSPLKPLVPLQKRF